MIDGSDFLAPHAATCVILPYGIDLSYWRTLSPSERTRIQEMRQRHPRHIAEVVRVVGYKGFVVVVRAVAGRTVHAPIVGRVPGPADRQQAAPEVWRPQR